MNYGAIKKCDIANGVGVRTVLFVSGCTHHCKGCFQPETWNFDYGERYTKETEDEIIESLRPDYVDGITLLGGEPFEPENQAELLSLAKEYKAAFPKKDLWCYTGFTFEQLFESGCRANTEHTKELVENIDVLVDGRYVEALHDISLQFRGSSNQRIIDVKKTLANGKITLWENLRK